MKKTILVIVLILAMLFVLSGCTEQEMAKSFGGEYTVELEQGKELVNLTWKENELWILVKDRDPDQTPQSYTFFQDSNYGIFEGTVFINEN